MRSNFVPTGKRVFVSFLFGPANLFSFPCHCVVSADWPRNSISLSLLTVNLLLFHSAYEKNLEIVMSQNQMQKLFRNQAKLEILISQNQMQKLLKNQAVSFTTPPIMNTLSFSPQNRSFIRDSTSSLWYFVALNDIPVRPAVFRFPRFVVQSSLANHDHPTDRPRPPSPAATASVPTSYDALHEQACQAVVAAIKADLRRMEIEYPALTQINAASDGSARSSRLWLDANATMVAKLFHILVESFEHPLAASTAKVYIVPPSKQGANLVLKKIQPFQTDRILFIKKGSLVYWDESSFFNDRAEKSTPRYLIFFSPSDMSHWKLAEDITNRDDFNNIFSIIVNGVFNNGYLAFEHAYYMKPMSGTGYVMRVYPDDFSLYAGRSLEKIKDAPPVTLLQQGRIRRPDLTNASLFLQTHFAKGL